MLRGGDSSSPFLVVSFRVLLASTMAFSSRNVRATTASIRVLLSRSAGSRPRGHHALLDVCDLPLGGVPHARDQRRAAAAMQGAARPAQRDGVEQFARAIRKFAGEAAVDDVLAGDAALG